jgi:hypothetical protein
VKRDVTATTLVVGSEVMPSDADLDPVIEAYKPGIDVTLLERNLRLTPEERLCQLMELQRFADELRRAARESSGR